ncbi:MAG: YeeE/YedE family protein [Candidatus Berkiella sp.]
MTIDWAHFTSWRSLAGGLLIGIATAGLLLINGKIAGLSGIIGGLIRPKAGERS